MMDQLQTWWQNTAPQTQGLIWEAGLALAALLGGHVIGSMVARGLRARNFDAVLRVRGSSPPGAETSRGFTATVVAGLLVRLTVWATAARWLANQHGWTDLGSTLGVIVKQAWILAGVLVAALGIASLFASRLIECLKAGTETLPSRNGAASPQRGAVGAVAATVYALVMLLVLLIAADFFDWPLIRSAASDLWQLAQKLLVAGAALLMGCLGAGWARDLATLDVAVAAERRAGQYTGLVIVAATTVLAVAVLLTSASVLFGLASLAIMGVALWLGRGYLPDIAAGLQLRAHNVREVCFEGASWQVADVGLLTSNVMRGAETGAVQNRLVLEARMRGAAQPSRR